jgi:hypothetical protein
VNQQDQQAIEGLFRNLYQASEQGTRDKDAEALIQRYVRQAPPGLLYQMAQRLVAQQATINQQGGWQQGRQGGGFLAGAGQLALGIGGGIIGAEVLTSIFDGAGSMFDGDRDREFDQGYREGFADGDNDGFRDGFAAGDDYQDQGGFDDPGGYDDGGGGGFDDGGGGFF